MQGVVLKFCLGSAKDDHSSVFFSFLCMCCALTRPAFCVVAQDDSPVMIGCFVLGVGWLVLFVFALAVLVVFDNYGR